MATSVNNQVNRLKEHEGFEVDRNGGLVRIEVHLTGISPLLMNAMSQQALLDIRDRVKKPKMAARPSLREEAESKIHWAKNKFPEVTAKAVIATLINAGKFVRLDGKRQISTATSTVLPGMLTLEDVEIPVYLPGTNKAATWEVDIQQGRNPNGGEAVCIVRPRFDAWECRITIEIDQSQMPINLARELIDIAGRRIGFLDNRPQRKGTNGRFSITKWKAISS